MKTPLSPIEACYKAFISQEPHVEDLGACLTIYKVALSELKAYVSSDPVLQAKFLEVLDWQEAQRKLKDQKRR